MIRITLARRIALVLAATLAAVLGAHAQAPAPLAPIDAAERAQVIEAAVGVLEAAYVFPDVAARMAEDLRGRSRSGEYTMTDAREFARALTRDLQAVSRDKHLRIFPGSAPAGRPHNFQVPGDQGLGRREVLPGNIGYLEVLSFLGRGEAAAAALAQAMAALSGTDALIIDVRANGGGSPETVAVLCSYLFERPTHLNSLYWRDGNRTEEFWTRVEVAGPRYGEGKPVYVLTSAKTFSGAEEFSYNLKSRKRATIVGSRTGGGAHPGAVRTLNDRFAIFVPTGRAVNPVTGTNWEGTGVAPDVDVPAEEALERALALARGTLRAS